MVEQILDDAFLLIDQPRLERQPAAGTTSKIRISVVVEKQCYEFSSALNRKGERSRSEVWGSQIRVRSSLEQKLDHLEWADASIRAQSGKKWGAFQTHAVSSV